MKSKNWRILFVFSDWTSAFITWFLFYYFRKTWIENVSFDIDRSFYIGIILVPLADKAAINNEIPALMSGETIVVAFN